MRITILGGASFFGYWIKNGFKNELNSPSFQIIDAPRSGIRLIKRFKDSFIKIEDLTNNDLFDFSPSIIVVNLYDLLSFSSLDYSSENNNSLINSINLILEASKLLGCKLVILLNKNCYGEETINSYGENNYYEVFSALNSFYYEYIRTTSKVYGIFTKIFLLPNIYGFYEPSESVVSSIVSKVLLDEKVEVSDGKRDFIYIKRIIPEIVNSIYYDNFNNVSVDSFTSNTLIEINYLYKLILKILDRQGYPKYYNDRVILKELVSSNELSIKTVNSNLLEDLKDFLSLNIS